MLYSVYVLRNTVNGMCYVGRTLDRYATQRRNQHLNSSSRNPYIPLDIAKFGHESFEFNIIHKGLFLKDADRIESQTVKRLDCMHPNGYNCTDNGKSTGRICEDSRRIRSESKKGENNPMYGKKGHLHNRYGKTFSDNHRRKLSESHRGQRSSPETEFKPGHKPHNALSDSKIAHTRYLYQNGIRPARVIASIIQISTWSVNQHTRDLRR